jgi:hypothetical protein
MSDTEKTTITDKLDRAGIWWGIFGPNGLVLALGTALFSAVISAFEPIADFGWAAVVLAAVFASALLLLLLACGAAVAAWAWRKFKPLANETLPSPEQTLGTLPDDDELRPGIGELEADIQRIDATIREIAEDRKAIISDYQLMSGVEAKLTERLEAIEAGARDYTKGRSDALQERLDEHRSLIQEHAVSLLAFSEATRFSITAIYHRERMLDLADEADAMGMALAKLPSHGSQLSEAEWEQWKSDRRIWESKISQWGGWAVFYLGREPMDDVKRINEEAFDEDWGVSHTQIPDPEGIRIYKTFRIYLRNWYNLKKVAHERVRMQAFEGQQTAERKMIDAAK